MKTSMREKSTNTKKQETEIESLLLFRDEDEDAQCGVWIRNACFAIGNPQILLPHLDLSLSCQEAARSGRFAVSGTEIHAFQLGFLTFCLLHTDLILSSTTKWWALRQDNKREDESEDQGEENSDDRYLILDHCAGTA